MCAKKDHASIGTVSSHNFPPTTQIHCWTNTPFAVHWFPFFTLPQTFVRSSSCLFPSVCSTPTSNLLLLAIQCSFPHPLPHPFTMVRFQTFGSPNGHLFLESFFLFFLFRSQRWEPSSHLGLPRRLRSHQKNRKRQIFRSIRWYECGEQWKVCR